MIKGAVVARIVCEAATLFMYRHNIILKNIKQLKMKEIILIKELEEFKSNYERISNLEIPMDFLLKGTVYGFFKKGKLVGGFILNESLPIRTIDLFIQKENHKSMLSLMPTSNNWTEVCCYWIDRSYRKDMRLNAWYWLQMAYSVHKTRKDFVLYGTNTLGLAKMYAFPKNSHLITSDIINGRKTFIFLAKRKHFLLGVGEIVLAKILKHKRSNRIQLSSTILKNL